MLYNSITFIRSNMASNIDQFVALLKCPLTDKIFSLPVVNDDGIVYEYSALLTTKTDVNKNFYIVKSLQLFILSFLENYPEYKKLQYDAENGDNPKDHLFYKDKIKTFISNHQWDEVKKYRNFSLALLSHTLINEILTNAPEDILLFIIDNVIDINHMMTGYHPGWNFFNYICRSVPNKTNLIKHCIKKGADVTHQCNDGWYPVQQILHWSKDETLIKYIIKKHIKSGLTLFVKNSNNQTVFDYILYKGTKNIIEYAINLIDFTPTNTQLTKFGENIQYNEKIEAMDIITILDIIESKMNSSITKETHTQTRMEEVD